MSAASDGIGSRIRRDCVTFPVRSTRMAAKTGTETTNSLKTGLAGDVAPAVEASTATYKKFTSQDELGHFLLAQYKIRTPRDLTSCEVCHR